MSEIKNLKKASLRIKKAIKNKERIILYGDADLDGATSVIIMEETVRNLGGQICDVYFPERETEGYGLSQTGLAYLQNKAPGLLVILDCGIGNFKEIILAKKLGFKTIIIDHHEIIDGIPKADIVVNPKQKGDRSFKGYANVGITFKLSELLLGKLMTENLRKNFLELVALATIADMSPREGENEIFITEGLRYMEDSWRPGLKSFFEMSFFENFPSMNEKISKIIQVLNFRDVADRIPASFRILTNISTDDSKELIKKLMEKSEQRREKIKEISQELEKRISGKKPVIFEGDDSWDFSLLSAVASILCQKYKIPAFIYKRLREESQGTVRTPSGVDSVALMKKCKKLLITYGGHPLASGFRVRNENLGKFEECLIFNCAKKKKT